MKRLKMLRLVVSHTQLYRKLTEFGHDHYHSVKVIKEHECKRMKAKLTASATETSCTDDDIGLSSESDRNSSPDGDLPQHSTEITVKRCII